MSALITERKKAWLLHQFRSATFYQLENWESLYEMERLMDGGSGTRYPNVDVTCPDCLDVVQRFLQLAPSFSKRPLCLRDVDVFFGKLYCTFMFAPKTKAALLNQLRKMSWTHWALDRIAQRIGHMIELDPSLIRSEFLHLATGSTSVDEITMEDVDAILGITRRHYGVGLDVN